MPDWELCREPERPKTKPRKARPKRRIPMQPDRTRIKTKVVHDEFTMTHLLTTPVPLPEPLVQERYSRWERISDTSGFLREWDNHCYHVVYREIDLHRPTAIYNPEGLLAADTALLPDILSTLLATDTMSPPSNVRAELSNAAHHHFITAVEPEVLLANFLYEMVNSAQGGLKAAEALRKRAIAARQKYLRAYREYLKKGLSDAAADWLAWNFAIKPAMRDSATLLCSIEKAKRILKSLVVNAGQRTRRNYQRSKCWEAEQVVIPIGLPSHYVEGWNPLCPPWIPGCIIPRSDSSAVRYELRLVTHRLDFNSQATVAFTLPPARFSDGSGFSSVWSSMTGSDRLGSILWEATPFSFVVDWFTDVGKQVASWIDGLTKNFPDGEIFTVGHSWKQTSAWELYYVPPEGIAPERLGAVTLKQYWRSRGYPSVDGVALFDPGGLGTGYHGSLEAALVAQRMKVLHPTWSERRRPIKIHFPRR